MPLCCPKCPGEPLESLSLPAGAGGSAHACEACHGFWVRGAELEALCHCQALTERDAALGRPGATDAKVVQCPDGHGLLRRTRVTVKDPYFLDRCPRCGGVWFDAGDWARLSQDGLLTHLSDVWSPAWRDKLSKEQERAAWEEDLRSKLGDEVFETLRALPEQLTTQEQRALALAYLSERLKQRH